MGINHRDSGPDSSEPSPSDQASFSDLGLRPELLASLASLGYEEPTPIQREAIPPLLGGRDLLGQASTGTGKTAAFALPVLNRIAPSPGRPRTLALVLVPTRELAMQVSEAMHRYGRGVGVRVLPIYGGQPIGRQLRELERGVHVVVATPGRALDHIARGTLDLGSVEVVVLDEADEMLDMGFAEDIESILNATPTGRQAVLFSATMPARIDAIARRHLHDPLRIQLGRRSGPAGSDARVRQCAYVVPRVHKPAALGRVLDIEAPAAALVFCRTREEVDQLTETLNGRGYRAEALHGGMDQGQRDRVMGRLRSGTADLLVATDVAARGLDVDHLTHVVNYEVPSAPDAYVHRIGRVGRAGREGVAITLVEPREHRMLKAIERATGSRISVEKLPTVADLHARRMDLTQAALREVLLSGDLDAFRGVVEPLSDEFDLVEVALAAVRLAHEAGGFGEDDEEIPEAVVRSQPDRSRPRGGPPAPGRTGPGSGGGPGGKPRGGGGAMARLFVGSGRSGGVRPQDLVGAITGETALGGRDIGAIHIAERFSLVEVPEAAADEVIAALRRTSIKGRKPTIRRERTQAV